MKRRKNKKSRLTKVDLNAVLQLQEKYCNLFNDVQQFMVFLIEYERDGTIRENIKSSEQNVSWCYDIIFKAIKEGRYTKRERKQ
jgi:hypothetical protein